MEKLRLEDSRFFSWAQQVIPRTENWRRQSCSVNIVHFLLYLCLPHIQAPFCLSSPHCRTDPEQTTANYPHIHSCSFVQVDISRLGHFSSCDPVAYGQLQGTWQCSSASASSHVRAPSPGLTVLMVPCPCPGRSSSAAQTVTGRWWARRPIWQVCIPQRDTRCSTPTSPGSLSLCTLCQNPTKG